MGRVSCRLRGRRTGSDVSDATLGCKIPHNLTRLHTTVQAHLQRYTEPSAEPIPATSTLSDNTLLPLGPGTLTHNVAGVPIIIACTKADLIDESIDGLGAGTSGMGGMVKGKGGEWEERTDSIMQILRTIALKCKRISC